MQRQKQGFRGKTSLEMQKMQQQKTEIKTQSQKNLINLFDYFKKQVKLFGTNRLLENFKAQ